MFTFLKEKARFWLSKLRHPGDRFTCPICDGSFGNFLPTGLKNRQNAQCPGCGSLERQRLLWLFLQKRTSFFKEHLDVLEIAPQAFLQRRFRKLSNLNYVSIDLESPLAMEKGDVTKLTFSDASFDYIFCYHVLEHVPEDHKAMAEMFRVLRPGGWGFIQSPVDWTKNTTFEDPSITDPKERERSFGQNDHVRVYGRDYIDRLRSVGFTVEEIPYARELGDAAIQKYSLESDEVLVVSRKN